MSEENEIRTMLLDWFQVNSADLRRRSFAAPESKVRSRSRSLWSVEATNPRSRSSIYPLLFVHETLMSSLFRARKWADFWASNLSTSVLSFGLGPVGITFVFWLLVLDLGQVHYCWPNNIINDPVKEYAEEWRKSLIFLIKHRHAVRLLIPLYKLLHVFCFIFNLNGQT